MFTIDVRHVSLRQLRMQMESPEDPLTIAFKKDAADQNYRWMTLQDVLPRPVDEVTWGYSPAGQTHLAIPCYKYTLARTAPEFMAEFGLKFAAVLMRLAEQSRQRRLAAGEHFDFARLLLLVDDVLDGPEPKIYIGATFKLETC